MKQDVKKDVAKGVVGNAATASDWNSKEVAKAKAATEAPAPAATTPAAAIVPAPAVKPPQL